MPLPSIERALVGLWIAESALTSFLDESRAELSRSVESLTGPERESHRRKLLELVGLEEDDAQSFAWQMRQALAILESNLLPRRIDRARDFRTAVEAAFEHLGGAL